MGRNNCHPHDREAYCCACNGRMHNPACTAKLNPKIDCCPARHKKLFDEGHKKGLTDNAVDMWTPEEDQYIPNRFWTRKDAPNG